MSGSAPGPSAVCQLDRLMLDPNRLLAQSLAQCLMQPNSSRFLAAGLEAMV